MTDPRDLTWWCTRCAAPAAYRARGLDARWPLGWCERVDEEGRSRSCGQVPVTLDQDEAHQLIRAHRVEANTARHHTHDPRHPNLWCRPCQPFVAHRGHVRDARVDPECDLCQGVLARVLPTSRR